jgi:hypothetical protein
MTVEFKCGSEQAHAALAAYLYGECDGAERAAVEAHLGVCAACAAELASLGATRSALASWAPPDATLGFKIVADRAVEPTVTVLRPARWWRQPLPAWAQAAAAILIFAAGGILGMRAGAPDITAVPVATSTAVQTAPAASPVSTQDLAALEQRLRREMIGLRSASAAPATRQPGMTDEQVTQRVRALLVESEQRQQREMSIRLAQVLRDVDMQRRMDLARIEDTFGQMEGTTGAELLRQREVINLLRQVSFPVQRPR